MAIKHINYQGQLISEQLNKVLTINGKNKTVTEWEELGFIDVAIDHISGRVTTREIPASLKQQQ